MTAAMVRKFVRRQEEDLRTIIMKFLTERGESTLIQIRDGTKVATRPLSQALGTMVLDSVVISEFIDGRFPRKLVYRIDDRDHRSVSDGPKHRGRSVRKDGRILVKVSVPAYLYEAIRREAIDQRRSLSAQVVVMLEAGLA